MDKDEVRSNLTGPLSSIMTPFTQDGSIDEDGLRTYIDRSIEGGSRSMILTAGDSQYFCLSDQEIAEVTRITVDHTAGRAMVISADRYYGTERAIEFARYSKEIGVDLYMALPPTWGGCTAEDLAQHFVELGAIMPVMVVTAMFTGKSGAFALETLRIMLDRSDRVMAIKDDRGVPFAQQMGMECHDRCAIFAGGTKLLHLGMVPFGVDGYMSMYQSFNPEITDRYWQAVRSGDFKTASQICHQYDVALLDHLTTYDGGWNVAAHGLLEVYGIAERWKRKPYTSLDSAGMERLRDFLKGLGVL